MNSANNIKVAFFSNQIADAKGHGLARYARELLLALNALHTNINVLPVAAWSSLDKYALAALFDDLDVTVLPWGRRITPLAWATINWPKIESGLNQAVNIVHAASLGYPIATKKPFVVTVHDIGLLTHPEFFLHKNPLIIKRSLQQAVKQADGIICVSQSTANELESYVGGNIAKRISVVHEGISPHFLLPPDNSSSAILEKLGVGNTPFLLSAGAISPRKNTLRIIQALSRVADVIPHHLVLVGGDGWSMQSVYDELGNSAIAERVHLTGYVSDEQLKSLFGAASAYLHPSLYEGFGLTLLEAMAQDCPVVTSNVYSLPEVAGDAAIFVDPTSVDEIAEAIRAVCTDSSLATDLVARGRERIKAFSWGACANGVIDIYRGVL